MEDDIELDGKCLTMSVPEAGKILGLGRDASYNAAHAGEIPTKQFGRLLRVPIPAFKKMLAGQG
ncbi:MAG: MerR family transcriptional regulator [Planctomycetota bacterium]|jgi:excisionase family DNA binding protein